jgi:carbamoyltransferase
MKVLGLHIGHDSSASLVVDGRIVADVAEERFRRIKHYAGLPSKSVVYCLESQGLTMDDIDIIAIGTASQIPLLNHFFEFSEEQKEKEPLKRQVLETLKGLAGGKARTKPPVYFKTLPVNPKTKVVHVDHHLSHAASAYYTSGSSEKQLVVTIDGTGGGYSTCIWKGENGEITPLLQLPESSSIGWFYSNVTEALGWWHGDGEGKTMGLAPYGDPEKVRGIFKGFYPEFNNGELTRPHEFGRVGVWDEGGTIQYTMDDTPKLQEILKNCSQEDFTAEAQRVLEEEIMKLVFPWLEKEKTKNLTCAGGVFLNVKLNQRIWESGKVEKQHIFPNAGDSGIAAGAALHAYFQANPGAEIKNVEEIYWGKEYSNEEIEEVLKLRQIRYEKLNNAPLEAAKLLADDKIVAWFQGRMESGPRALGNRSILVSANKAENKDILNAKVKFREGFRPFCPSLLWDKKEDYLENVRDEFFMITSFTCKLEKRDKVPAAVHADHTLRPQTVKKDFNPRFWDLINEFGKITGEYLVINTSFNLMGEPIIEHPRDAIRCFYDNGIDCLILGDFILKKQWD